MLDEEMWTMGIYVMRAVGVTVGKAVSSKSKLEYFDKPIMQDKDLKAENEPERELTAEEKKQEQEKLLARLQLMMGNFEASKKS